MGLFRVAVSTRVDLLIVLLQVYEGCCRLRISFSQHTNLNVKRNSDTTWDYTNGGLQLMIPCRRLAVILTVL